MTQQELSVREKKEAQGAEFTRAGRTFLPDVDICETPDCLRLWADMPGVDEQSIEVRLENNLLTVAGQVSIKDYEDLTPVYTEYRIGNYARQFTVSSGIDVERIKASITNGVLEVELPKTAQAKPRRIEVAAR